MVRVTFNLYNQSIKPTSYPSIWEQKTSTHTQTDSFALKVFQHRMSDLACKIYLERKQKLVKYESVSEISKLLVTVIYQTYLHVL